MLTNILMVGVGGQGIVLSSDIVCDVALAAGFDVKKSEIHGMAQRGGSVVSHVRIAEKVFSPVISEGDADIVMSFEQMEFLRYLEYPKKDTTLLLNTNRIFPPGVASGKEIYPEELVARNKAQFGTILEIDAATLAREAGSVKAAGTVMLGLLAKKLPFAVELWHEAISGKVPAKLVDVNLKCFNAGYQA